jgi:hypothetical protein
MKLKNCTTVHTQFFPPKPLLTPQKFFLVSKPLVALLHFRIIKKDCDSPEEFFFWFTFFI